MALHYSDIITIIFSLMGTYIWVAMKGPEFFANLTKGDFSDE